MGKGQCPEQGQVRRRQRVVNQEAGESKGAWDGSGSAKLRGWQESQEVAG